MRTALKRLLATAAIIALSLQLAIPAGFMPATVGDGWYLKWCPDGMSEQAMMTLFGHDHHHNNHEQASSDSPEFSNCELAAFSADLLQASVFSLNFSPLADVEPTTPNSEFSPSVPIRAFLARAPPVSTPT